MSAADRDLMDIARRLADGRRTLAPVPRLSALSVAEAGVIRWESLRLLTGDGVLAVAGYKVSLSCTWGALTDDVVFTGATTMPRNGVLDPLLEAELVFLVESDLTPDSSIADIVEGCRVAPGIEVADSRWEGWRPSEPDRFVIPSAAEIEADNAVSGWLVIGDTPVPAREVPLPDLDIVMRADGREVARGSLADVMGHPAEAVRWVIRLLAEDGLSLRPGHVVSSGCPYSTFVTAPQAGGTWEAVVEGIGRATLTLT